MQSDSSLDQGAVTSPELTPVEDATQRSRMNAPGASLVLQPSILFVDDEARAVKYFERAIGTLAPVLTGGSVEEGIAVLDAHADTVAVLVSDQRMPGVCGNELLRYASEKYPHVVRILTTAYSEIDQTVEAVNHGQIHRYIKKPWDITALRLELKQALDLAALRKERDQLLREKLMVLQRQVVAARIGTIRLLSASLIGAERFEPVETYLTCAAVEGIRRQESDWLSMNHADQTDTDSLRAGQFGQGVLAHLGELRVQGAGAVDGWWMTALAAELEKLGGRVRRENDAVIWNGTTGFCEFLEDAAGAEVPARHAAWLAILLWLAENGVALSAACEEGNIVFRPAVWGATVGNGRLAVWIEHFWELLSR